MRSARIRTEFQVGACVLLIFGILIGWLPGCHFQHRTLLKLSVAASLQDAVTEIEAVYKKSYTDMDFSNNFGSSGTLGKQIEQGAPADIYFSAALKPMDDLEAKGMIATRSRRNLLRNRLVLIGPSDSRLKDIHDLKGAALRAIALGDPGSVPVGQYGRQALLSLHLWDELSGKLVLGRDVRQVLTYVETGDADAGLVYVTDALPSRKVRIIASFPEWAHDPIIYPVAVVKGSRGEQAARRFTNYLFTPAAQAIFEKHGFTMATP